MRPCCRRDTGRRGWPWPASGRKAAARVIFGQPGQIVDKQPALRAPELPHRGREQVAAPAGELVGPLAVAAGPGQGARRVLEHRGRVEVERALLVPLLLVGDVVDPDLRNAEVLHRQQPVLAADRCEIAGKPQQPRIGSSSGRQVARFQVMPPAIEVEGHAGVQQRPQKVPSMIRCVTRASRSKAGQASRK